MISDSAAGFWKISYQNRSMSTELPAFPRDADKVFTHDFIDVVGFVASGDQGVGKGG
ncbi:hypothetical protein SAMN02744133_104286 [Thalassospira xiamenensis M-5 = DSM 17429]|nr:hypothetical protein SAMN02744133_104286 [Thalassospira xiamenensis M-5 = DSM 17429]